MTTALSTIRPGLADLVDGVRSAVSRHADWSTTARLVAEELRRHLPTPDVLTPQERRGDPAGYLTHTIYTEPDGSFSIVAVVWLPGQITPIHDHVTWCVFGVLRGVEYEELYALRDDGTLAPVGENANRTGEISGFAPPGDIHRVRNSGDVTAISLHVYGTDVSRVGSSVRRFYDQPVRP